MLSALKVFYWKLRLCGNKVLFFVFSILRSAFKQLTIKLMTENCCHQHSIHYIPHKVGHHKIHSVATLLGTPVQS